MPPTIASSWPTGRWGCACSPAPGGRLLGSFSQSSPATMSTAKTKAQKIIDENNVVVFSKSYCPYCKASKALLNEKGAKYFLMELDQVGDVALPPPIIDSLFAAPGSYPASLDHMLILCSHRGRRRSARRTRRHYRPALSAEYLHQPEAHWWQLGSAS